MTFYDGQSEELLFDQSFIQDDSAFKLSHSIPQPLQNCIEEEAAKESMHDIQSPLSNHSETIQQPLSTFKSFLSKKISPIFIKARQPRKPRCTITKQILNKLNQELGAYHNQCLTKRSNNFTLKQIARKLKLGYRTILQKYKEFRVHKEVKEGVRLKNKHSSYKKSLQLVNIVTQSLNNRKFRTTTQLCKYIKQKYKITYKRTRVSNYSSKIKFKDFFNQNVKKENKREGEQSLSLYQRIIMDEEQHLIYYSEQEYQSLQGQSIRVLILCSTQYIQTLVITSSDENLIKEQFFSLLAFFLQVHQSSYHDWFLIGNVKDFYQRLEKDENNASDRFNFEEKLLKLKGKLFCLPLGYQRYNPAYFYCQLNRMSYQWIHVQAMHPKNIDDQLLFYKKTFSATCPSLLHYIRSKLLQNQKINPDM